MLKLLEFIGRATYRSIFFLIFWLGSFILALIRDFISAYRHLPLFHRPKIRRSPWLFTGIFLIIFFLSLCFTFYWYILKNLPSPAGLINHRPTLSTKIYDRNQTLLFTFYKDQNRTLISLKDVPEHFKLATLAIEDSQFYNHRGVSFTGILRSLKQIILNQELQGGSTITQQLIKNALLTPERTLNRKLKELILSAEVEWLFSKDEILEMYLNQVSYGGTAYGAEQAAQTYFGKSIKDVSLAEAALLAGLPASPTTYSPFGLNPYLSIYRQHQVLNRMVTEKYIAPFEAELAKEQKIVLAPQTQNIKAPHFVMFVKDLLVKQFGETLVEQGGLTVTTSLDLPLQEKVQTLVTQEINQLFPMNITNGATLVPTPKTGEILAMVGSRDYFDTARDGQVNLTTSLRQPGSAIKPVNYSVALTTGFTAASIIEDSPVTYDIPGSQPYSPVNYDGKFHGPITLRQALANSYNVPAVKVLATYGVSKMIDQGKKLGITTWNQPKRYGLSLTLGGAEVKMTDLAVVFGTLANQGQKVPLRPILKVTNSSNQILLNNTCSPASPVVLPKSRQNPNIATLEPQCNSELALNPDIAFILSSILSDPNARAQAFGLRTYLNIPKHQVAVKTGTTNDKRDNWTIGYTADFLTAVWVGNNNNSPMSQVASGISGASPIWNKIMVELLKNKPEHQFLPPANLVKAKTCRGQEEYFIPGTEANIPCPTPNPSPDPNRDQILTGTSIN